MVFILKLSIITCIYHFRKNNFFFPYTDMGSLSYSQSYFDPFSKIPLFLVFLYSPRKLYFLLFLTASACLTNSSCCLATCLAPQSCSLQALMGSFSNSMHFEFPVRDQHPGKDGGVELHGHTRCSKSSNTETPGTFWQGTKKIGSSFLTSLLEANPPIKSNFLGVTLSQVLSFCKNKNVICSVVFRLAWLKHIMDRNAS